MLLITVGAAACVVPRLPAATVLLFALLSLSPTLVPPFHIHCKTPLGLLLATTLLLAAALILLGDLDDAL